MQRTTRIVDGLLNTTLTFFMAALVINVLWQVASRYVLGNPSSVTEEIARFLLLWIGILGGTYAYRHGSHLGLDLLTSRLHDGAQRVARRAVLLAMAIFAVLVLVYGGGRLVWLTLELRQTSGALGIPMGWVYSVLPLSGGLVVFYSAVLWRDQGAES